MKKSQVRKFLGKTVRLIMRRPSGIRVTLDGILTAVPGRHCEISSTDVKFINHEDYKVVNGVLFIVIPWDKISSIISIEEA